MGKHVRRVRERPPTAVVNDGGVSDTGVRPISEIPGGPQGGTPDEDEDGLDDVARALRDAAEGPIGRRELGK